MNGGSPPRTPWRRWTTRTLPWSSTGWNGPKSAQVRGGARLHPPHAGIDPWRVDVPATWDEGAIERLMAAQRPDDPLWIRDDFWTSPTGLVNERGEGPIASTPAHAPRPTSRECSGLRPPRATRTGWHGQGRRLGQPVAWLTVGTLTPVPPEVLVWPGPRPSPDDGACFYEPILPGEQRRKVRRRGLPAPDGAGGPSRFSPWGRAAGPWPYLPALWLRTFCGMVAQLGW